MIEVKNTLGICPAFSFGFKVLRCRNAPRLR